MRAGEGADDTRAECIATANLCYLIAVIATRCSALPLAPKRARATADVDLFQQQQRGPSYAASPSYSLPSHSPLYTSLEEDLSSSPGPGSRQQKQKTPRRNGGGGRKNKGQQYGGGGFETGNEADESAAGWEEGRGSRGGVSFGLWRAAPSRVRAELTLCCFLCLTRCVG